MSAIFLVLFLAVLGNCGGTPPIDPRSEIHNWPGLGFDLCKMIVHVPTRENCFKCFGDSGSSWIEGSECVSEWLPKRFVWCVKGIKPGNNGAGAQKKFEACLRKAETYQREEMKRAAALYTRGSQYLARVGDSKIVKDGGAAMFSCMAQELLVNSDKLQDELAVSAGSCFNRFQMDPINEQWHLHKGDRPQMRSRALPKNVDDPSGSQLERNSKTDVQRNYMGGERTLVYEYGYVGHDMPFHGIGPLAVDILKGECIFNSMDDYGDLDELAKAMIKSSVPIAPWIFREILNEITSINLP